MLLIMFKPTYLYIKQHSGTGLLYFGKTIRNPELYQGSGSYWRNHINKHGKDKVETLWYCLFLEESSCKNFAVSFSEQHDIIKSKKWANQIIEEGTSHCGSPGRIATAATRELMRALMTGKKHPAESNKRKGKAGEKNNMFGVHRFGEVAPHFGKRHKEETLKVLSLRAKSRQRISCPHCKGEFDASNAGKYHFDKCKLSPTFNLQKYAEKMMLGRVSRLVDRKEFDVGNWAKYLRSLKLQEELV